MDQLVGCTRTTRTTQEGEASESKREQQSVAAPYWSDLTHEHHGRACQALYQIDAKACVGSGPG